MGRTRSDRRAALVSAVLVGALVAAALLLGLPGSVQPRDVVAAPVARDGEAVALAVRPPPVDAPASTQPEAASPAPAVAAETSPAEALDPGEDFIFDDHFVHVPARVGDPARVLVVLHGMGGAGREMCEYLRAWADRERWILVGPTFNYGDWTDPEQVAREGPRLISRLAQILDELPARIGRPIQPRVALYGFSRGGQVAHRFAMLFPERVDSVVILAAGTYTLPVRETTVEGQPVPLRYPVGAADIRERFGRDIDLDALRRVKFWIGVGAEDRGAGLPPQWTPYLGETRVERAHRFAALLRSLEISVQVVEFPGLGHDMSEAERDAALAFVSGGR